MYKQVLKELWTNSPVKMRYLFFYIFGALTILAFSFWGCNFLKKYPQDNVVEEIVEEMIEQKTGLDLDFSPLTPESKTAIVSF